MCLPRAATLRVQGRQCKKLNGYNIGRAQIINIFIAINYQCADFAVL